MYIRVDPWFLKSSLFCDLEDKALSFLSDDATVGDRVDLVGFS